MTFTVGETVVYPNHGAAIIEDIETRQIKGEDREYLVLRIVAHRTSWCAFPRATWTWSASATSWTRPGLYWVFDVLRAAHVEEPTNWSRRYKANLSDNTLGHRRTRTGARQFVVLKGVGVGGGLGHVHSLLRPRGAASLGIVAAIL